MSSSLSTSKLNRKTLIPANFSKTVLTISMTVAIAVSALATSGCNTTQGFKPTASVMVGGQKSI